eukprot:354717-Chlamydomonas_euryale.AAC.3
MKTCIFSLLPPKLKGCSTWCMTPGTVHAQGTASSTTAELGAKVSTTGAPRSNHECTNIEARMLESRWG